MPYTTFDCSTNYSRQRTASSTLAAHSMYLHKKAWSKVGTVVYPNAAMLIPRSCSSSCCVLVNCLASAVVARRSTVRTTAPSGHDVEKEIQTCLWIRVLPVACREEEIIELEIRDQGSQYSRTGVARMDLTSQGQASASADCHKRQNRSSG